MSNVMLIFASVLFCGLNKVLRKTLTNSSASNYTYAYNDNISILKSFFHKVQLNQSMKQLRPLFYKRLFPI